MTERADRLTKCAKRRSRLLRPVVLPCHSVHVFVDALERLDCRIEPLLANAGIRRADLDDPDARIPCTVWGTIFCRALEQRPMKNAGMRLATVTPIGAFPLIDYLIATSQNVREGSPVLRATCVSPKRDRFPAFARRRTRFESSSRVVIAHFQPSSPSRSTPYQQLLDLARKDAAERYLTDSLLSITEVAYLLGYSEPAAFNRAFRRWRTETPQGFRRRQRFKRGNTSP